MWAKSAGKECGQRVQAKSVGIECKRFTSHLACKLVEKRDEKYSKVINWIRTRLSFAIMRAVLICVRGTRSNRTITGICIIAKYA